MPGVCHFFAKTTAKWQVKIDSPVIFCCHFLVVFAKKWQASVIAFLLYFFKRVMGILNCVHGILIRSIKRLKWTFFYSKWINTSIKSMMYIYLKQYDRSSEFFSQSRLRYCLVLDLPFISIFDNPKPIFFAAIHGTMESKH